MSEKNKSKGLHQQIEEAGYTSYEGNLTPEILIDFLEELNTKKPYINPTEGMSEKAAIAFNEAMKEYVKKNY
jgi:hypothetical protein